MTMSKTYRDETRTVLRVLSERLRKDAIERGQVDEVLAYGRVLDDVLQAENYDQGKP